MPIDAVHRIPVNMPPALGPGSGKDAWMRFARDMADSNGELWDMVERQSEAIRELEAEVELLKSQISTRKPKGGRRRLKDGRISHIDACLAAGFSRSTTEG